MLQCIKERRPATDFDAGNGFIDEASRAKITSLRNFFGEEFQTFGGFIVWDIDPWKQDNIVYNIGCYEPCIRISEDGEASHHFTESRPFIKWLDRQNSLCQVDQQLSRVAPWQRIILCQGLSLAPDKNVAIPFHLFPNAVEPIRLSTNLHLSGARRGGSETTNPYSDPENAFHITFYERFMPQSKDLLKATKSRNLKVGHLFGKPEDDGNKNPDELAFRRSAFTMIATSRPTQTEKRSLLNCERYWTMLILSPSGFFPLPTETTREDGEKKKARTPVKTADTNIRWKIDVGQASQQTAELSCIVYALREVDKRWRQFNEYIGSLLVEDFMDPKAYTTLLFDDETFSRSRLYFWILGCLNDFDADIEDNIKQWTLYRQARLRHLLDLSPESSSAPSPQSSSAPSPPLSSEPSPEISPEQSLRSPPGPSSKSAGKKVLDPRLESTPEPLEEASPLPFDSAKDLIRLRELDKEAQQIKQFLEDLRKEFKARRATVQGLRDGLFNASALMESRSSTRLGMNVQLLTYVSIFYLPLAFCAGLWAIPNINENTTRNPFICTTFLVGFCTYAVVFNLGNISAFLGGAYFRRRDQLLQKMEGDPDESWKTRRRRFDEFPPNQERKTPSEWWMVRYQMRCLLHRLYQKMKNVVPYPVDKEIDMGEIYFTSNPNRKERLLKELAERDRPMWRRRMSLLFRNMKPKWPNSGSGAGTV